MTCRDLNLPTRNDAKMERDVLESGSESLPPGIFRSAACSPIMGAQSEPVVFDAPCEDLGKSMNSTRWTRANVAGTGHGQQTNSEH